MDSSRRVINFLEELRGVAWFHAIGQPLAIGPPQGLEVSRVGSWERALRVIRSRQTDEFLTRSRNYLYRERDARVRGTKPQKILVNEFNNWISSTRPCIRSIAEAASGSATVPPCVSDDYPDVLVWLIGMACVVYQFDEYIKENRLYCYISDLLKAGHCVCGWDGEYPDGSLVVY